MILTTRCNSFEDKAVVGKFSSTSKPRGQVWIFFENESPNYFSKKQCLPAMNNKINWTVTYRRDADFTITYGYFRKSTKPKYSLGHLDGIYAKKTKTAVVFMSNCDTFSKRMKFIKSLRSHGVDVDIFGKCGKVLDKSDNKGRFQSVYNISRTLTPDFFPSVLARYKFYLSFENSLCLDYTTEKSLHRVMQHPIVPVIRDGSNTSLFHPHHSYINTEDYKSVKDLAQYMKKLANDKTAYLEYFNWKRYYYTDDLYIEWNNVFCRMCERLHNPESFRRIYRNITSWHMSPGGKNACYEPTDLNI
ncbi:4-galactosyl-N-acetylglucosaminide 3-alpha-L-fucosyltransferase FUT5-like [Argopecten irradians]|uniref:4-galactosyl-N-acetylglucosaminide 3-alpha-L-fucosyltransferase FUT5-like n=1 Tax=Argopecten irradians TaxID=31199 RepID=UPI003712F565